MTLETKLLEVFCCNMVAYYRAHQAHINITGRNFESDHALLGEIYEDTQDQIDTLGELLRTIKANPPQTLQEIIDGSDLSEESAYDPDGLLNIVLEAQEYLMDDYKELFDIATRETDQDIANYAADRLGAHAKFAWKLRSTLE